MLSRRDVCRGGLGLVAARAFTVRAGAQAGAQIAGQSGARETARPDVGAVDEAHIVAMADRALGQAPSLDLANGAVPALAAGYVHFRITEAARAERYRVHAAAWLRTLFVTATTRLNNELAETNHPEDVLGLMPLGEIAQAIPFLASQRGAAEAGPVTAEEMTTIRAWFAGLLTSMNNSRTGGLARDHRDHVAGVWLLVATASARLTGDEAQLLALRHLFKTVTLRAQVRGDGLFPHELTTRDPYRNSLFALDLLTACCELLSTKFESLWEYELQDGPGMRVAIAKHAPWIENRNTWPYPADQSLFHELPCRRPALLFAAHAYSRPEYATIWRELVPAEPTSPMLLASFPVRQPLLWVTRLPV